MIGAPVRVDHPRGSARNRMAEQEVVKKVRDMGGLHMSGDYRYAE